MRYVLDTNVLLYYAREGRTRQFLDTEYGPFRDENEPVISLVTVAEIRSLSIKLNWGSGRSATMENLIEDCFVVPIASQEIVNAYVDVESYSIGKHPTISSSGSDVLLGKNDLWIAATAVVTQATLLTSDGDFDHLHKSFFPVIKYGRRTFCILRAMTYRDLTKGTTVRRSPSNNCSR